MARQRPGLAAAFAFAWQRPPASFDTEAEDETTADRPWPWPRSSSQANLRQALAGIVEPLSFATSVPSKS